MYLIIAIFTGITVSMMIQLNGMLQAAAGGLNSLLAIHLSGLAGTGLLFIILRGKLKGDKNAGTPIYYLCAGMVGILIVYFASVSFEKGGILMSLSGSLAGQTLMASIIESFYPPERPRSPMFQRIVSPALLILGSIIIGLKSGAGFGWIAFSWLPGIILMFQQSMSAGNTARYGTSKTVLFNYLSALVILVPLFVFKTARGGSFPMPGGDIPLWLYVAGGLIGVYSTAAIAVLLLKAPALLVILGIYCGELIGGTVLDLASGNPVVIEKVAGICLLALGLAAGRFSPGKNFQSRIED